MSFWRIIVNGIALGVFLALLSKAACASPPAAQPRLIILLLGDDVELDAVEGRLPMPELDAIKDAGTTYGRVVSLSTVCRPALIPWMWPGVVPWEAGIFNIDSPAEAPIESSIFNVAKQMGYHPIGAGKFWEPSPAAHDPIAYGAEWWFDAGTPEHDPPMIFARQTVQPVVDEINRRLAAGEKVLAVLTPMLPHQPRDASPATLARVPASSIPACPPWVYDPAAYQSEVRKFLANHLRLDDAIGEIRRGVPKDAQWVVAVSDNGLTVSERSRQFSKQGPYAGGYLVQCIVSPSQTPGRIDSRLTTSLDCGKIAVDLMRGRPAPVPSARRSAFLMTYARGGRNWPVDIPMAATLVRADGWSAVLQLTTWYRSDEVSGDVTWKHQLVATPPDPVRTAGTLELYAPGDRWQDLDVSQWNPAIADEVLEEIARRIP